MPAATIPPTPSVAHVVTQPGTQPETPAAVPGDAAAPGLPAAPAALRPLLRAPTPEVGTDAALAAPPAGVPGPAKPARAVPAAARPQTSNPSSPV